MFARQFEITPHQGAAIVELVQKSPRGRISCHVLSVT